MAREPGALPALALGAVALCLAMPAPASAVQRFAEPGGADAASDCTGTASNPPCSINRAVENVALPGDEVIVAPGDYDLGAGNVSLMTANVTVHGADGQAMPRVISSSGTFTFGVNHPSASLRRVAIEHTGGAVALSLIQGRAEQVFAHTTSGTASTACNMGLASSLLRDSVCWNTSADGDAYAAQASVLTGSATMTLRNVTAVATGPGSVGLGASASNANTHVTADARNVIARGSAFDAQAAAGSDTSTAMLTLTSSNYVTQDEVEVSPGTATVTDPGGPPANQTGNPLFADAAAGDFHQLPGSPTIDAGSDDATLGSLDIDGEPRVQGAAVDIGADELMPAAEPEPAGDTAAPDTTITRHPKNKTKKRRARFEFTSSEPGSTFECSLDDGAFAPCSSPHALKVKKGKHDFEVRATDASGNADPTPATDAWKVKNRKR